jgi:ABC-type multidrug transport system ATPase subunit/pSer/pThr/pTyr-binding forkhead associated (FHA) protein
MIENICPHCRTPNRPGSRFCIKCGRAMAASPGGGTTVFCPQCRVPVRMGARFCPTCGYPLKGVPAAARKAPSGDVPTLVVRWPGGQTEEHALSKQVVYVGRASSNDIVLNFPTVSSQHLKLDVSAGGVRVTDLNSTNGTQLNGQQISPNVAQPWRTADVIRVGDLRGNSVSMTLKGPAGESLRTRALGMQDLAQFSRVRIGRDPSSELHLDHPVISWHHAELLRQNGGFAIRDLGSTNGTFVNGRRVTGSITLNIGDVVQIGPYKLVYDGKVQGLAKSVSRGHRLDAINLGMQVSGGRMILTNISLSVQAGEFVALVGGSGAGKSTLMKAMNGFNPATHGQMLIDGENLYTNLGAYRTLMGYVPQDDIIHKELPVRLALWYAAKLRLPDASAGEIERRIQDVLRMVEMTEHAEKPVKVLSGGQRKRVSIAVELLAQPDLLFLDEPTSGLDPGLEKKMMYDLNLLADQGRTVMLVTHATANIEQCNHVTFLVEGNLAYYGPPSDAISFFQARDFADIYLKLSEEVNPAEGKMPSSELQPYYQTVQARQASSDGGVSRMPAGLLWAEHYRHSQLYRDYVASRLPQAASPAQPAQYAQAVQPKRARDSMLRQLWILARRQFDLIRHDLRTLFILLLMMPIIASLFMLVSHKDDLTGKQLSPARIEAELKEELADAEVDEKSNYMPEPTASQLLTMLGLAITQAGTFGAAYEIVKERAIFRRERAVNLRVGAYVVSKVLVLGCFAVIQVISVLLVISLKVDLGFDPIFEFFPSGAMELFVTLLLAVLASIMLGLFVSAVVPTQDVVLYVILVQLFVQIILSGTLFPLPDNPAQKLVVSYWTMDAMGSTVDVRKLNEESIGCTVVEMPLPDGSGVQRDIVCDSAAREEEDLGLDYEHSEEHLLLDWVALLAQTVVWGGLTMFLQMRKKSD